LTVGGGNAGRFLTAVLESVQAKIGLTGGIGMAVNSDYAALFAEFWVIAIPGLRSETGGTRLIGVRNKRRSFASLRMTTLCGDNMTTV
jgi:hypothetical protein